MAFSRRHFLGTAGAVAALEIAGSAHAAQAATIGQSPVVAVGKAKSFKIGTPIFFQYPDKFAPAMAIRMSKAVKGGVGPGGDIIAYSQLCVHRGCPVQYNADSEIFMCPCHYTAYDADKGGQVIIGHATTNLPRIVLAYDASTDAITAVGVDGLIYGRSDDAKLS